MVDICASPTQMRQCSVTRLGSGGSEPAGARCHGASKVAIGMGASSCQGEKSILVAKNLIIPGNPCMA